MFIDIFQQLNFLDLLILILLFRICYIAIRTGLAIEFFKLSGVVFAIYIASHYYVSIADMIRERYLHQAVPLEFADFLVFCLLALLAYLFFVLLRITFYRFMKMEAAPNLNKYGGLILGLARGYFSVGLLVYLLMISSVSYLNDSVKHSYLGTRFSSVSAQTYNWIWDSVFSKFFPQEKSNVVVNEVRDNFTKK